MKVEDFAIGDVLSYSGWDSDYTVFDIVGLDLYLENNTTKNRVNWSGYLYMNPPVTITPANVARKSAVERKIARLHKLFEERNKEIEVKK